MRTLRVLVVAFLAVLTAQAQTPQRPKILGISHVGYFVSNLDAARQFWHGLLGFDELPYGQWLDDDMKDAAYIKINAHQHVELITSPPTSPPSHMHMLAFVVSDIEAMKTYLRSEGFTISERPRTIAVVGGQYAFSIHDPEGLLIQFVQARPESWESVNAGKFEPATRISTQIFHAGFTVHHLEKTMDFYQRVLGFSETWRGSSDGKVLSWINMKVPDGTDYVEFMLGANADQKSLGTKNHLSLAVPDMDKAAAEIKVRAAALGYAKPIDIHTGVNRKRQVNLYDPDETRVELMEPFTVDGKPAVPSAAAPPME